MITEYLALLVLVKGEWCPGAELNSRHADFQSAALPTELPGPKVTSCRRLIIKANESV